MLGCALSRATLIVRKGKEKRKKEKKEKKRKKKPENAILDFNLL